MIIEKFSRKYYSYYIFMNHKKTMRKKRKISELVKFNKNISDIFNMQFSSFLGNTENDNTIE